MVWYRKRSLFPKDLRSDRQNQWKEEKEEKRLAKRKESKYVLRSKQDV
jgi:hypothetical protein